MKAVITGDIINSRSQSPAKALSDLKTVLKNYGQNPKAWEIYRGDSFQLFTDHPENSLDIAMHIKAKLKTQKGRDVRMAIGIGEVSYQAGAVTESNGEAFVWSGDTFEQLKNDKVNLAIKSPWQDFDQEMNLFFRFALMAMDNWSEASAEFMNVQLMNEKKSQEELSKLLGIGQSSVSERKKRAHYDLLLQLKKRFKTRVEDLQ